VTLTLPRVCHAGLSGPDVRAYSRVYRGLGIRQRRETRFFGVHMVGNTEHFQRDTTYHMGVTLKPTGIINQATFLALRPHLDPYSRYLIGLADKQLTVNPRDLVVGMWLAMLRLAPFPYEQIRPYPSGDLAMLDRVGSDCSGTFELAYKYAHGHDPTIPDPSNYDFDGYGWTGSLDANGTKVRTPRPGDACFYYPDHGHVGGFLGGDRVFSHGKTGDPHVTSSSFAVEFRSYLP
jgi:hypothetical protein